MHTEESEAVWRDWHIVGADFRSFERLSEEDQQALWRGETVTSGVVVNDDMLWGSVFRYVPTMSPAALASVFHDYDGQYRYVPGMPETRVVEQTGKLHRVFHRISAVTFVYDRAQQTWPAWLYNAFSYTYELDEEVFRSDTSEGPGYAIRWTIPLETQILGGRENGEIRFTHMGDGTLVSYNNATEPFGYKTLKSWLPGRVVDGLCRYMGALANDYYERTVVRFIDVAEGLDEDEITANIQRMLGQPGL